MDYTEISEAIKIKLLRVYFSPKNKKLEKLFDKYQYERSLKQIRISILIAAVIYFIFGISDIIISDDVVLNDLLLRYYIFFPISFSIYGLTFLKKDIRILSKFTAAAVFLICVLDIVLLGIFPSNLYLYYVPGLILIILFGYIFLRVRPFDAILAGLSSFIFYNFYELVYIQSSEIVLLNTNLFLISANCIGIFMNYIIEINLRKEFLVELKLKKEHETTKELNQNLEEVVKKRTNELENINKELQSENAERKATEEKLFSQKKFLNEILDNVQEGIGIINENKTFVFANKSLNKLFNETEITNKNILDFFDIEQKKIITSQKAKTEIDNFITYEVILKCKEETKTLQFFIKARFSSDDYHIGDLITVLDITQEKKTEKKLLDYKNDLEEKVTKRTAELRESNNQLYIEVNERILAELKYRRFKAISDNANYGSAIVDMAGRVMYINNYYAEIHGYKPNDIIRKNIDLLHSEKQYKKVEEMNLMLKEKGEYSAAEVWHINKDEVEFPMLMSAKIIKGRGDKHALVAITAIDISERKQAEELIKQKNNELEIQRNIAVRQRDELENRSSELEKAFKKSSKQHVKLQKALMRINEQNEELEKANREIRVSSKLKEIFLANTSHEIRTPLNAILGFTNLLLNTQLQEKQFSYLKYIKTAGDNLLVIINDILDFSKIEAGKLTLEKIDFDFRHIIKSAINTLNIKALSKNINLSLYIDPAIPEVLKGDSVRLNQILTNLLGNGIKFTDRSGKVNLEIYQQEKNDNKVKLMFKVSDSGIGIREEKLRILFESFTQAESDTSRKYGGTGLGLSIVKRLVELQSGRIHVDSKVSQGTTFSVYLTFDIGKIEDIAIMEPVVKMTNKIKNLKILLVEDNGFNQQLAVDTLKEWNSEIEIDIAEDGQKAIDKLEENTYHLILMDIQMPIRDGFETTIYIRKEMPSPKNKIPIIAMTANAMQHEKEKSIKIGMNYYITKPFIPDDLFTKINLVLANKEKSEFECAKPKLVPKQKKEDKDELPITGFEYINLSFLTKLYRGKTEKVKKILGKYVSDIPNQIIKLQELLEKENWEMLSASAHTLKSVLAYLGMKKGQENCKQIEHFAKQKINLDELPALVSDTIRMWSFAEKEIDLFLEEK